MKLILHSYRRCPFCIRTRILLYLKKIPHEIVEEPIRVWTPWLKAWAEENNERPRVPILRVIDDNDLETIIPESNTINLFLDTEYGVPEFTPEKKTLAYEDMLAWWKWCSEELKPVLDLYKYGENLEFNTEKHVLHTIALQNLIQVLENTLAKKKFLVQERLTLADIAIIPFIRQIMRTREGEFDFTPYPKVLEWVDSIILADWFENILMQKN